MAKVTILHGGKQMVRKLNARPYLVDIRMTQEVFDELIKNGFSPEEWSRKNHQMKVIIDSNP